MDYEHVITLLRNFLMSSYRYRLVKAGKEIAIRCPFCGDSQKDNHPHLYINLDYDKTYNVPLFPFQCKRAACGKSSKIMSLKDAATLGIMDEDILNYLEKIRKKLNNRIKVSNSSIKYKSLKKVDCDISNELSKRKLDYIYNRLGYKDIYTKYNDFKIIIDLVKFYTVNKLPLNYDLKDIKNFLRQLHNNCIGFLSMDNTKINFRDITNKFLENRYFQYNIYPEKFKVESSSLYTIPNKIDILNPNINLVMAEGIFDILRIFTDFYNLDYNYGVFASVNTADGYISMIKKIFKLGVIPKSISIYSDSDVNINYYIKKVKPLIPSTELIIFYNNKSKDYGDIKDPLSLNKKTL